MLDFAAIQNFWGIVNICLKFSDMSNHPEMFESSRAKLSDGHANILGPFMMGPEKSTVCHAIVIGEGLLLAPLPSLHISMGQCASQIWASCNTVRCGVCPPFLSIVSKGKSVESSFRHESGCLGWLIIYHDASPHFV